MEPDGDWAIPRFKFWGDKMNKAKTSTLALGLLLALAAPAGTAPSPDSVTVGRLMVHPHRVILDDSLPRAKAEPGNPPRPSGRSAEIALINGGRERSAYRISFVTMGMDTDGRLFEKTRAPGELTAEDLIRYSPRQVVLEPGTTQTVRIQVRMREGLPPGEYLSHMMFRAVPMPEQAQANPDPGDKSLSVSLKAVYGISIPIIIRHGATQVDVRIAGLELAPPSHKDSPPAVRFRLDRSGNKSAFGHIEATWTPRGGLPKVVGMVKGVAIYANLGHRDLALELDGLPAGMPGPGRLKISYLDAGGKVMAEAGLELPNQP